jgi:Chaperone of endosialidase
MPRNPGTGVYSKPSPDVITDTTIESTVYNTFVGDVETDLNTPRPVSSGGTGANNATQARDNLDAERSLQQVTNYDTHAFECGSFYSVPGATAAPNSSDIFFGTAYTDVSNGFIEARSLTSHKLYLRTRGPAGAWSAWSAPIDGSDKVNISGDTMTGNLTAPSMTVTQPTAVNAMTVYANSSRTWSAGCLGDGGFSIFDNITGSNRLSINASGIASFSSTINGAAFAFSGTGAGLMADSSNVILRAKSANNVYVQNESGSTWVTFRTGGITAGEFYGISGSYQLRMQYPSVRDWGIAATSAGDLTFDDVSLGRVIAKLSISQNTIQLPLAPTTASAANVAANTGVSNAIYVVTSSLRYKTEVKPLEKGDADKLLLLEPITYKSKSPVDDPNRTWFGFIAEQVAKIEPRLVTWAYLPEDWVEVKGTEGTPGDRYVRDGAVKVPDGLQYERISVLAVFKMQEQEGRIKAQEDRIAELIARIETLEAKVA